MVFLQKWSIVIGQKKSCQSSDVTDYLSVDLRVVGNSQSIDLKRLPWILGEQGKPGERYYSGRPDLIRPLQIHFISDTGRTIASLTLVTVNSG